MDPDFRVGKRVRGSAGDTRLNTPAHISVSLLA